jgi:hypothetical protein
MVSRAGSPPPSAPGQPRNDVREPFEPFGKKPPGPPEFFELFLSFTLSIRPCAAGPSRRDRCCVDEAVLLDSGEQHVNGPICDVGEALLPQPGRDLVALRLVGPAGSRGRCLSSVP